MADEVQFDPSLAVPVQDYETIQTSSGPIHIPPGTPPEERQRIMAQLGVQPSTYEGRPVVRNPDGSWSHEKSITIEAGGKHMNIPTMFGGKSVSPDQAVEIMRKNNWVDPDTGKPVATFGSQAEAIQAAQMKEKQQQSAIPFDPKLAVPVSGRAAPTAMTKESDPGFVAGVAQAGLRGAKESITQQGLRELIKEHTPSGAVSTVARETALAPLEVMGTATAPAAAIGGMAGEAAKRGLQAVVPESLSPENDPTGSQAALLQKVPGAVGAMIDFGTNMMLPSKWATGGVNRLLSGWGAKKYAGELGGASGIIKKGAGELTGNAAGSERFVEDAGQKLAAAQLEASKSARAATSKMRADAISAVPTSATIPNSISNTIRDNLPETGALSTTAQRKIDKVAKELENTNSGMPTIVGGVSTKGASPAYVQAVLGALGKTATAGAGKDVTFAELIGRREALSSLAHDASSDADRRLYRLVISAVDKDIDTFGQKYPQAATMYREFQAKYQGAVAQYHAKEAPLRNLVENAAPSEMMGKLRKLDVESIRNIKNGIVAGPNGMQAMEQIKSGVLQSLVESGINPTTGGFNTKRFLNQLDDTDTVRKLREILGDKFSHLAMFRDALVRSGAEKAPEAQGMLRMMGTYQLVTAAEQTFRAPQFAFYHYMRAATMFFTPKLFAKMMENKRGALLIAEGILAKPGSPKAASVAGALESMAKGMGAQSLRALPAASSAAATELPAAQP